MATHDYVIANGTGAAVRSDLNNALAAIVSNNSSSTEPGTTYAYQWWADTNANVLKIRNSSNDAWITLRELDGTMLIEDGTAGSPGLAFADDTNTGLFSSAADTLNFSAGGSERLEIGSSAVIFNDGSNDVDFRVESNGETHMLFVDAGNDRVGIGVSAPKKDLHVDNTVLLTGSAPQIRLSTDANDASDDNRAMFGLCTSAGNFFGGSAVGDTVIRTTNGGNLLFGEGTTETARIAANGDVGIGIAPAAQKLQVHESAASTESYVHITNAVSGSTSSDGLLVGLDTSANAILWNMDNTVLKFGVNNAERMRLTTSGLTFNGDTAAANALDDYEEGTFTPTYLSGLSSPSYSDTTGTYTKIGNLVTFTLRINATGTNVGSHARIGSLPFTSSSSDEGSASFGFFGNLSGNQSDDVYLHIAESNTIIEFYYASGAQFLGNGGNGLSGRTLHIRGFYYA